MLPINFKNQRGFYSRVKLLQIVNIFNDDDLIGPEHRNFHPTTKLAVTTFSTSS